MSNETIRALLVEENFDTAERVRRRLGRPCSGANPCPQWSVEHAATFDAALARLRGNHIDVILFGLNNRAALDRITHLRQAAPKVPLVALAGGADEQMVATIRALTAPLARGENRGAAQTENLTLVLADHLQSASGRSKLTPRELEVVQLIAEGRSTKEVAQQLGISFKTVETHRTNLMRKLRLRSVSDLVRYAIRNKIAEA
jgi:DNA-binding NarL/FixJ family response regulator